MDTNEIINLVDELWAVESDLMKIDRMVDEVTKYFEHTSSDKVDFSKIQQEHNRIRDFLEIAEIYILSGQSKIQSIGKELDTVIARRRSNSDNIIIERG